MDLNLRSKCNCFRRHLCSFDPRVLALVNLKIFVGTSLDVCLARRLSRDVIYRGREIDLSVLQWQRFVKPNFERHVRPSMLNADIRIPRGIDNLVAIDLLMAHIQRQLEQNSITHMSHILSLSTTQDRSSSYQNLAKESDCDVCTKNLKIQLVFQTS